MLAIGRTISAALVCFGASCGSLQPSEPTLTSVTSDVPVPRGVASVTHSHDECFGEPGPLRVQGYPGLVGSGFAAVAVRAGFSREGDNLGVCWSDGGSESMHCRFIDRHDAPRSFSVPFVYNRTSPRFAIDESDPHARWLATKGIPRLIHEGPAAYDLRSPPIEGVWRFGRDIELRVVQVKEDAGRGEDAGLLFGGSVRGRAPVFPITIRRPRGALPVHFVQPSFLGLSPDGSELGLVVLSAAQEYDSTYTIHRWPVEDVAAQIYAATAETARRAGDAAGATELCALALYLRAGSACRADSSSVSERGGAGSGAPTSSQD